MMCQSPVRKIALLSLFGFCLAVVALAFHCCDNKYLPRSRSICQVRTAFTGTISKISVDYAAAAAVASLGLAAVFFSWAPFVHINAATLISSRTGYIFPNKAPPVRP